jgi:protease-4
MRVLRFIIRFPFVLILNLLAIFRWALAAGWHGLLGLLPSPDEYLRVTLEGDLPFGRDRRGLAGRLDRTTTFLQLRRDLKRVADDAKVRGVVLDLQGPAVGRARAQDLAELLEDVRQSGKRIVATFDMATTSEYVLACAADDIVVTPAGRLYTFGSRIEQIYFTPLLRRAGITAQFVHIGAFKTAYNRFVRDEPSPGDAAMTHDLRRSVDALTTRRIADSRGIAKEQVTELFRTAPVDARWSRQRGLVDAEAFARDLPDLLEHGEKHVHKPLETKAKPKITALASWIDAQPDPLRLRPFVGRDIRIAVIDLSGLIIMPRTNVPGASQTIDPDDVLPVLESIERSGRYDGLLVHINSPGGSALASDILWHALDEVRAHIPVVAYCSEVVGSGGYYLACGADAIFCREESIVGSIGVITGKISAGGALEHLGLEPHVYQDDDAPATMLSLTEAFDEDTLEHVKAEAREFYRRFLHRVGLARGISKRRLHRFARGRVYLGEAALSRGLVDGIGGFDEALAKLEELIGESTGTTTLQYIGIGRRSIADAIRAQLVPSFSAEAAAYVGRDALQVLSKPAVLARMLEREHTLAITDLETI